MFAGLSSGRIRVVRQLERRWFPQIVLASFVVVKLKLHKGEEKNA